MKEYKYKINGNLYNVVIGDIEDNIAHVEVNGTHYTVEMEKKPKAAPAPKPVVRPAAKPAAAPAPAAAAPAAPAAAPAPEEKKKALTSQMVINALDDGVTNSKQLTIRPVLQREVTSILKRHADTNYTGRGWAVVLSMPDGAVLAMADCGAGDVESRPLAVKKFFDPGHTVSPFPVVGADDHIGPHTAVRIRRKIL